MRRYMLLVVLMLIAAPVFTQAQESTEGFRGIMWGWAQMRAERAFGKLFDQSDRDRKGILRYADTLAGFPCEIIPIYEDFTFTSTVVRFYDSRNENEQRALFDSLAALTSEMLGQEPVTQTVDSLAGDEAARGEFAMWFTPESYHLIRLRITPRGWHNVDVLHASRSLTLTSGDESALDALAFSQLQEAIDRLRPSYIFWRFSSVDIPPGFPAPGDSVDCDVPPVRIEAAAPIYPELGELTGTEGVVYVQALVDQNGDVVNVRIAKASGTNIGFEEAATKAAWDARFKPAAKDGKPVAVWVTYPVYFKLKD